VALVEREDVAGEADAEVAVLLDDLVRGVDVVAVELRQLVHPAPDLGQERQFGFDARARRCRERRGRTARVGYAAAAA
jgi:hypothetical protein